MRRLILFLGAFSLLVVALEVATAAMVQSGVYRTALHVYIAYVSVPALVTYILLSLREIVRTKAPAP